MRPLPALLGILAVATLASQVSAQSNDPQKAYQAGASGGTINQNTATYEEKSAYNSGVAEKEAKDAADREANRKSSEASMAAQSANRAELESVRSAVMKQPALTAAKNPLLGRWVMISPKSQNLMDMVLNPAAAVCAAIFGNDQFEYRADALVLDDDGRDVVADRVAYRAGKDGSVFALGEKLIRLLVFEFDVGKDRMKYGECIYERVRKGPAAAASAAPMKSSASTSTSVVEAPAAATGVGRSYKGAGFKVGGLTLGVDGSPQLYQLNKARGAEEVQGSNESLGAWRVYARGVSLADIDPRIVAIGYDFDQDDFSVARIIGVTYLYNPGAAQGASLIVQERAKALATKYGLPAPAPGMRWEGKTGEVTLMVAVDPATRLVAETYLLK